MINLKQAAELKKLINPKYYYYTAGRYFDTANLSKYQFICKKYNNNLIIIYKNDQDDLFIIGSRRIIRNIRKKYNFTEPNYLSTTVLNCYYCYNYKPFTSVTSVYETEFKTFGYSKEYYDKDFINFLKNDLKDLNDSEKLFIEMEV